MNKVKIAFYVAIILGAAYRIYQKVTTPSEGSQPRYKVKEARLGDVITRRLFNERRDSLGGRQGINFEHSVILTATKKN